MAIGDGSNFRRIAPDGLCGPAAVRPAAMDLMRPAATRSATATPIGAPTAPTSLVAAVSGLTVILTWAAPAGVDPPTSYVLEAGSASGLSDLANSDTGSSARTLTATDVPPGTYFVRVRARNANGTSAPSNEIVATVGSGCLSAPGAPTGLTTSVNGTTVVLTWTAPAGSLSSYVLEVGSTSGTSNLLISDTGSLATSLTATGPAGTYYVRIRARNACGRGPASNEAIVIVTGSGADQPFDLIESFLGMDATLGGPSPDVALAVGRSHLLLARNTGVALWRKAAGAEAGRVISAIPLSQFFASVIKSDDKLTDPSALFDDEAGRFFLVNAALNTCPDCGFHLVAVSKSSSPETLTTRDWYFYRFDRSLERTSAGVTKTDNDGDYDKLAAVGSGLVISWPATHHNADGSAVSIGARVRVLDKDALMAGQAPDMWIDLLPAASPNARARVAGIPDARDRTAAQDRLFMDLFSTAPCGAPGTWTIGALTRSNGTLAVTTRDVVSPAFSCSIDSVATQPGTARPINVGRFGVQPIYRDGRFWVFESRGVSQQDQRAGITWMELDVRDWPTDVRVVQSGMFSEPGVSVFAPAATLDSAGNLVMMYTRSGPGEYPSIYYTGRLATDALNTLRQSHRLRAGSRVFDWRPPGGMGQTFNQFIDYGAATVDPVDGSVWMAALVPSPDGLSPTGVERSDAWIGRVRPLNATR